MSLITLLSLGCTVSDDPSGGSAPPIGYYEGGWPIDACSADFAAEGTGFGLGDILPQAEFVTQTNEIARLHDWCGHVVYIEIGTFT